MSVAPSPFRPMGPRPVRLPRDVYVRRRVVAGSLVAGVLAVGFLAFDAQRDAAAPASQAVSDAAPTPTAAPTTAAVAPAGAAGAGLDGGAFTVADACTLTADELVLNDQGADVACLQRALTAVGTYSGALDGVFDDDVYAAVVQLQEDEGLFPDGVVGYETAGHLGIRTPVELHVVRTPAPPAKTMDRLGYYLSSVASKGSDAPALPADSGTGRRVVYDRLGQRVWAVDDDGAIIRSWLVSGSKYDNEPAGTFKVYSRSEETTAWNGKARLPKMIRYFQTDIGHIGFHGIPTEIETGKRYQTDAELGTPLSGGCQRQADLDAAFMWEFAQVGTKVVVV